MAPFLMILYRVRCNLDVLALKLRFYVEKFQFDFFIEEIAVLS